MNADVDADVYCSPTVCVAYPANSNAPASAPARSTQPLVSASAPRYAGTANGASTRRGDGETPDEIRERRDVLRARPARAGR